MSLAKQLKKLKQHEPLFIALQIDAPDHKKTCSMC